MSTTDIKYFGFLGIFVSIIATFVVILFAIWGAFSVIAIKVIGTVFIISCLTALIGETFFDE